MNLAYHNRTSRGALEQPAPILHETELNEIASLVDRFNRAHVTLNEVELALHDSLDGNQRSSLMQRLEDARGNYMDARFALSQKQSA